MFTLEGKYNSLKKKFIEEKNNARKKKFIPNKQIKNIDLYLRKFTHLIDANNVWLLEGRSIPAKMFWSRKSEPLNLSSESSSQYFRWNFPEIDQDKKSYWGLFWGDL